MRRRIRVYRRRRRGPWSERHVDRHRLGRWAGQGRACRGHGLRLVQVWMVRPCGTARKRLPSWQVAGVRRTPRECKIRAQCDDGEDSVGGNWLAWVPSGDVTEEGLKRGEHPGEVRPGDARGARVNGIRWVLSGNVVGIVGRATVQEVPASTPRGPRGTGLRLRSAEDPAALPEQVLNALEAPPITPGPGPLGSDECAGEKLPVALFAGKVVPLPLRPSRAGRPGRHGCGGRC